MSSSLKKTVLFYSRACRMKNRNGFSRGRNLPSSQRGGLLHRTTSRRSPLTVRAARKENVRCSIYPILFSMRSSSGLTLNASILPSAVYQIRFRFDIRHSPTRKRLFLSWVKEIKKIDRLREHFCSFAVLLQDPPCGRSAGKVKPVPTKSQNIH